MSSTSVERVLQILYFLLEVLSSVPDQKFRFTFTLELPDPGKPKITPVSRERKNLDRVYCMFPRAVCPSWRSKKRCAKFSSSNFFGFGDIKIRVLIRI